MRCKSGAVHPFCGSCRSTAERRLPVGGLRPDLTASGDEATAELEARRSGRMTGPQFASTCDIFLLDKTQEIQRRRKVHSIRLTVLYFF